MEQNLVNSFKAVIDSLNRMSGIDLYKSGARALLEGMSTMLDNITIDKEDEEYLRFHIKGLLEDEGLAQAEDFAMQCSEFIEFNEDDEPIYTPYSLYKNKDELPF